MFVVFVQCHGCIFDRIAHAPVISFFSTLLGSERYDHDLLDRTKNFARDDFVAPPPLGHEAPQADNASRRMAYFSTAT